MYFRNCVHKKCSCCILLETVQKLPPAAVRGPAWVWEEHDNGEQVWLQRDTQAYQRPVTQDWPQ